MGIFSPRISLAALEWRRTTESRILSRMPGPRNSPWWEGKERAFVLDSVAVSWAGIPPYNPQLDPATKTYFTRGVSSVLKKTKQNRGGTSQLGLLAMGVPPRVSSATGMYLITFSKIVTCVIYFIYGELVVDYALWAAFVSCLGSVVGLKVANWY